MNAPFDNALNTFEKHYTSMKKYIYDKKEKRFTNLLQTNCTSGGCLHQWATATDRYIFKELNIIFVNGHTSNWIRKGFMRTKSMSHGKGLGNLGLVTFTL